jgi:hypothetical protein
MQATYEALLGHAFFSMAKHSTIDQNIKGLNPDSFFSAPGENNRELNVMQLLLGQQWYFSSRELGY